MQINAKTILKECHRVHFTLHYINYINNYLYLMLM